MAAGTLQILAFIGAPASGKTVAATVAKDLGIPVITMGDVIRDELQRRTLPVTDENAGSIANELRANEGLDAIAKRCFPRIHDLMVRGGTEAEHKLIVVDGIRGSAEVEAFKREFGQNFALVLIDAPLSLRYTRIKNRGRGDDLLSLAEFKTREARENRWGMGEAMKQADYVVRNEGSLRAFKERIKALLQNPVRTF
ncbi:MAG: flagellar hook-basal body complex protein FliE [Methanomicrobia archaeon]|nr:flagellar hook-basal body complex protein FliE [Methanomicrobia archaeon]